MWYRIRRTSKFPPVSNSYITRTSRCNARLRRLKSDSMATIIKVLKKNKTSFAALVATWLCIFVIQASADPPNTQQETIPSLRPEGALAAVDVPEGFRVSLFASEPQVRQPIAMAFDTRGRLWAAECYTYTKSGVFDLDQRDRVLIFEDTDNDGRADRRSVFWDQGRRLSSVEIGFGGVWVLCPPQLLFIPDRDRDDHPDGEPIVVLDGWATTGHTFVNGLRWGPDGWLYGRHGIQGVSYVGAPGTPDERRTPVNCGIWRYHPQRKTFEMVCHGTTNPWGMDWDDHGELFFINTVIGHLWHAVPGAHFRRMYGDDLRPQLYELIEQTADHVHWDEGQEDWTATRKELTSATSRTGGGHAHTGLMIYLGENWPPEYRGELFTLNLHGRRINHDHLQRAGATYVGQHRPDFMSFGDPWFRPIDLAYGRDGGVYILDWSDIGECHEADGIHRTSGRIYKVWRPATAQQPPSAAPPADPYDLPSADLAGLQLHRNEWLVRQSRRVLAERAAAGDNLSAVHRTLRQKFADQTDPRRKLRALWSLYVTGGIDQSRLMELLADENEHLRAWGIRLLIDQGHVDPQVIDVFQKLAKRETSGLVLTYLASALERLPDESRFQLADALSQHGEFADDRVLPLLIWYGVEPAVLSHPDEALRLIGVSRMPRLTRYVARRLTGQIEARPDVVGRLVEMAHTTDRADHRREILRGMAEALRGWNRTQAPPRWAELVKRIAQQTEDKQVGGYVRELSIVFGEGLSVDEVIGFVLDREQPTESRRAALKSLVASRAAGLEPALKQLVDERPMADEAVRGLAALDLSQYASYLVDRYRRIDDAGKKAIVAVLATRADTAALLLDAVARQIVAAGDVDAFVLRQIQLLGDDKLAARVAKIWPDRRLLSGDKLERIKRLRDQLNPRTLAAADQTNGRKVYRQTCGQCHKLFGEGGAIGPELTGAQRHSLDYWLENMVDPSAAVPEQYRMSVVALDDGRVLSGLVRNENERVVALQTPTERRLIDRSSIETIQPSPLSMMPEGQLDKLSDTELRDLVGYLMSSPSAQAATSSPGR